MTRVVMAGIMVAIMAGVVWKTGAMTMQFKRQQQSFAALHALTVAKDYLIALSVDVDGDGNNELHLPGAGNTLPATVLARVQEIVGPGYPAAMTFCTGPANSSNGAYAANSGVWTPPAPIGKLISPGQNGVLETACTDATAGGDDVMLNIAQAEIKATPSPLGGFVEIPGQGIKTVVNNDNVNLSSSLFTIGNFTAQPSQDPNGNAIKPGTVIYVPAQGGNNAYFAYYNGSSWTVQTLN